MISRALFFALLVCLAGHGGPAKNAEPRLLNQSAKQDIEGAALVVLARVESVSDTASHIGPAGYRPVEADLSVRQVLKGSYGSERMCIIYMYPYGGYDGPGLAWIEAGTTGVFSLVPNDRCFRVVNDRRAIIRSYALPKGAPTPLSAFVAAATLPTRGGCSSGINQVASEIWSISIPLIGSRATWRLLQDDLGSSDANAKTCACAAMASVWKVDEACLDRLPSNAIDPSQLNATRATNRLILRREQSWLQNDPIKWLQTIAGGWGVDGALVRLHELLSRKEVEIPRSRCAILTRALSEGGMDRSLSKDGSDEATEQRARRDLNQWLELGCPATPGGLRSLVGERR